MIYNEVEISLGKLYMAIKMKRMNLLVVICMLCITPFSSSCKNTVRDDNKSSYEGLIKCLSSRDDHGPDVINCKDWIKHSDPMLFMAYDRGLKFKFELAENYASLCYKNNAKDNHYIKKVCAILASSYARAQGKYYESYVWSKRAVQISGIDRAFAFDDADTIIKSRISSVISLPNKSNYFKKNVGRDKLYIKNSDPISLSYSKIFGNKIPGIELNLKGGDFRFYMDTGSTTFVSKKYSDAFGFVSSGYATGLNGLSGKTIVTSGIVNNMKLPWGVLKYAHVIRSSVHSEFDLNIIGIDILSKLGSIYIDYGDMISSVGSNAKLMMSKISGKKYDCTDLRFDLLPDLTQGFVSVYGSMDGIPVHVVPDTGNTIGFIVNSSLKERIASSTYHTHSNQGIDLFVLGKSKYHVKPKFMHLQNGIDVILPRWMFNIWFLNFDKGRFCFSNSSSGFQIPLDPPAYLLVHDGS